MTLRKGLRVRLILHPAMHGQANMAVDEALYRLVGEGESSPVVRLYGFSPPTLSLGRFQRVRERLNRSRMEAEGVTLVRRPTGGQAVLHDRELTYAVVLGRGHGEPFGKREVYRLIAGLLLRGLAKLGVRGISARSRQGSPHNPDCFASTGEYEIEGSDAHKLIGSAQMIGRHASLQHGAIPLDHSYTRIRCYLSLPEGAEELQASSLAGELGREVAFQEAVEVFSEGFAEALAEQGATLERDGLSRREEELAEELRRSRYAGDAWNLMF